MKKTILFFISVGLVCSQTLQGQVSITRSAGFGTTSPSSACLACAGSIWNNEANIYLADGIPSDIDLMQNAFCFQSSCYYSRSLVCKQFGFSIPGTATIVGIEVNILRDAPGLNIIKDSVVVLMKNGTTASSDYKSPVFWPVTYTSQIYGGPANLWGLSWTPADINDPATLVALNVYNKDVVSVSGVNVDHVSMTVYYTTATGIVGSQTSSPNEFIITQEDENTILCSFNASGSLSPAQLNILDISGKKIYAKDLGVLHTGRYKEEISVSGLANGIYFTQYINGDKILTRKFNIRK